MSFIRFNAEEIRKEKGYAPLRTYYCVACGCWHLTSKPVFPYKSRTQKVLEAYKPEKKKTPCIYTARDIGLTLINDENLNRIVETNLLRFEKQKEIIVMKEKVNKLLKILDQLCKDKERPNQEKEWLEKREITLQSYEQRLQEWKKVEKLHTLCKRFLHMVKNKKLLPCNRTIAESMIERVNLIIERRKEIFELTDQITFSLQDACSYLQSDMIASAKAKVKDAEKNILKLKNYQINGFIDAMDMWNRLIISYKTNIEDRCRLEF